MTDGEEFELALLHADNHPALDQLRYDPECARVLAALDLVVWDLQLAGTTMPPPSL